MPSPIKSHARYLSAQECARRADEGGSKKAASRTSQENERAATAASSPSELAAERLGSRSRRVSLLGGSHHHKSSPGMRRAFWKAIDQGFSLFSFPSRACDIEPLNFPLGYVQSLADDDPATRGCSRGVGVGYARPTTMRPSAHDLLPLTIAGGQQQGLLLPA